MATIDSKQLQLLHAAIKENEEKSHALVEKIPQLGAGFRDSKLFQSQSEAISRFENMFASQVMGHKQTHEGTREELAALSTSHADADNNLADMVMKSNRMLAKEAKEHRKLTDYSATAAGLKRSGTMQRDRALAYLFIVLGVIAISALAGRGGKALIAAYVVLALCGLAVAYFGIRALLGWLTS